MTLYNVHLYREMRLMFTGIEADTPEEAAALAGDKPTSEADDIEDCEGESLTALVDVEGDEEYEQSRFIDFEAERQRKAASALLAALTGVLDYAETEALCLEKLKDSHEAEIEAAKAWQAIDAARAVAEATAAGIISTSAGIDVDALLAERRQIADIWSVLDVQAVRPDLTDAQAWDVLEIVRNRFDAAVGINWEVLRCHADEAFGSAPGADVEEA